MNRRRAQVACFAAVALAAVALLWAIPPNFRGRDPRTADRARVDHHHPTPSSPVTTRSDPPPGSMEEPRPQPSPSPLSEAEWDLFEQTKREAEKLQAVERTALDSLAVESAALSAVAAESLEDRLRRAPGDPRDRVRLLGFYAAHADQAGAARRRADHLLWLTEHHPELPFAGAAWRNLVEADDPSAYEQAERLWNLHTRATDDARVAINAARFFAGTDPRHASELLARALSTLKDARRNGS